MTGVDGEKRLGTLVGLTVFLVGMVLSVASAVPAERVAEDKPAGGDSVSERLRAEQLAAERLYWESVKDSDDAADLQAYLDRYPGGAYDVLARTRLRRLASSGAPPVASAGGSAGQSLSELEERVVAALAGAEAALALEETRLDELAARHSRRTLADGRPSMAQASSNIRLWERRIRDLEASERELREELRGVVSSVGADITSLARRLSAQRARAAREQASLAQAEREKAERERAERERVAREQAEREKVERERAERERVAREQAEREKVERERAERERVAREQAEREKVERERAERERVAREQAEREKATRERAASRVFRDCLECPELVVAPAGSFLMGSPDGEAWRFDDEGPRRRVEIAAPFAVGVHEVTRVEFARFVRATGHSTGNSCWIWNNDEKTWVESSSHNWRHPGYSQTYRHPVVCVSWEDAQAYARWLSEKTGHRYRLLSESEWEYVARAGTRTARYWGYSALGQCNHANGADTSTGFVWRVSCDDGHARTSPVGTYTQNGFGLHDVLGNVWEWVQDCWHEDYEGAPGDGRAWEWWWCGRRVVRGGSWSSDPRNLRAANRYRYTTGFRHNYLGFRIARTLTP